MPINKQNSREALLLQACARQYYDKATKLDMCMWGSNIILPTFKLLLPDNTLITLLLIINFFVSIFSDECIKNWTNTGADMKLLFDSIVFDFDIKSSFKEKTLFIAKQSKQNNRKFFEKQMKHTGANAGVKSWYSKLQSNSAARKHYQESQQESKEYDKKMYDIFQIFSVCFLILIIGICWFYNLPFNDTLTLLFLSFASLTKKVISTYKEFRKEKIMYEAIDNKLSIDDFSQEDSIELFDLEDKKRRLILPIKGILYRFVHRKMANK